VSPGSDNPSPTAGSQSDEQPAADPRVSAAFALGWQIAELYRPGRRRRASPATPDDLPGLGVVGDGERAAIAAKQVQAALTQLRDPIAQAGLAQPDPTPMVESTREGADPDLRRPAVLVLHRELLGTLTATNFRFGKAYGLGRALADTCRNPSDRASLEREFQRHRVATLTSWIDDLGSTFPAHAGHSVGASLQRWADWVNGLPSEQELETGTLPLLRRQGELWRALLSGEKLGADMLEIANYLDAADRLAKRLRALALRVITRFPIVSVLVVALFGVGVWLILDKHTSASIAAGLGGILTSLGLSWKGIGGSLVKLSSALERPLWGAEVDAAITDAITLLHGNEREYKNRRLRAVEAEPAPVAEQAAAG
jgi:hypothetical protein